MKSGITKRTIICKFFALFVALVSFISISASRVHAQARPSPMENVISIDPIPALYSYPLLFQYEYKDGPVNSWLFRINVWPSPNSYTSLSFGIGAAYRFYIADSRALTGLSVAPVADIFFFKQSQLGYHEIDFDIGGELGYKWIFDDFAVEPIVGLHIGFGPTNTPPNATGLEPLIGISGGYAF